jgi:hypothetical protein
MNGLDLNIAAYQILTDLLVTIRRIVHRGLEKASGKTWYLDGCPPGLFETLVERKEGELAIDRFAGEYQELITFASLDDLAAMIDYNGDLAKLLAGFESEGTAFVDRLREIETLRLKLAASSPFTDEDLESLDSYHREFRNTLARRKQGKSGGATPRPAPVVPDGRRAGDERRSAAFPVAKPPPVSPVATRAAGAAVADFRAHAAAVDELVDVVDTAMPAGERTRGAVERKRPFEVEQPAPAAARPSSGTAAADSPTALDAERAMAVDDDREVMGVIHREVMAIADAVFRRQFDLPCPAWDAVRTSGWYDLKKAELALAPLELFYEVVAEAAADGRAGAEPEAVSASLHEKGFTKLLLSLREMFVKQTS